MLSIIGSALSMGAPLFIWAIKVFVGNKVTREKYAKNYYDMIDKYSKRGAVKVANYFAAEASLARVQLQIREEQLIEPDRELSAAKPVAAYAVPAFLPVPVKVETHGNYLTDNGQARGLVVHYTAGRFRNGGEDAANTLSDLAKRGFGCLVMDVNGVIYKADNQKIDEIAWHAGKSGWLGATGLSRYCFGMEICNAGRLSQDKDTWGQANWGEKIAKKDVRTVTEHANQRAGLYHQFTKAQERSLINFILWQLDTNPDFDLDWVIGHDECAPERKTDPGGSLSMTMPAFRTMLKQKN